MGMVETMEPQVTWQKLKFIINNYEFMEILLVAIWMPLQMEVFSFGP
jgi:hypothetical protein